MKTTQQDPFTVPTTFIGVEILDVVSTLKSKLDIQALYCFGIRIETALKTSCINPYNNDETAKIHLDLLALSHDVPINAIADLDSEIREKTNGYYNLTLLLHKPLQLKKAKYKRFFQQIIKTGWLMQAQNPIDNLMECLNDDQPSQKQVEEFTKSRLYNAKQIFELEYTIDTIGGDLLKVSLLHLGVEQLCLAIIYTYMGYYPNHFHLKYLFDLCANCTPIIDGIFPRKTEEDKTLLQILNTTPKQLRFKNTAQFTITQIEVLEERCQKLYQATKKEIQSKIKVPIEFSE